MSLAIFWSQLVVCYFSSGKKFEFYLELNIKIVLKIKIIHVAEVKKCIFSDTAEAYSSKNKMIKTKSLCFLLASVSHMLYPSTC